EVLVPVLPGETEDDHDDRRDGQADEAQGDAPLEPLFGVEGALVARSTATGSKVGRHAPLRSKEPLGPWAGGAGRCTRRADAGPATIDRRRRSLAHPPFPPVGSQAERPRAV